MKKLWMSWSTGKDSAYALHLLRQDPRYHVAGLFTTVNRDHERVAMHATRDELLRRQAEALGLPLEIMEIGAGCTNEAYETAFAVLIAKAQAVGVEAFGFGDLFLEDIRAYRERTLNGTGIEPVFPLWSRPTAKLAREMIDSGIRAVLTCIDPRKLDASFAGRFFESTLLADLPESVDPCGENGEFHSFVFSSPGFRTPIAIEVGEIVHRDGFVFADVLGV